jgi:hypothetical protein
MNRSFEERLALKILAVSVPNATTTMTTRAKARSNPMSVKPLRDDGNVL